MLPSPDEFAALVAAYPDVPKFRRKVSAAQAAELAAMPVSAVLAAHKRAESARARGTWRSGMMPEPVKPPASAGGVSRPGPEPRYWWWLSDLIEWRAVPSRGAGGGAPPSLDYSELLLKAIALAEAIEPFPLTSNRLRDELGLGRGPANKVLGMYRDYLLSRRS